MPRHKVRKKFTIAKLQKRARKSQKRLVQEFPHVSAKLQSLGFDLKDLRRHSAKIMVAAAIAGTLLAVSPTLHTLVIPQAQQQQKPKFLTTDELAKKIQESLELILPNKVGPLSPTTEANISTALQETLGI